MTNAASGLTLTDGTAITLSLVNGQIIGTVGNDVVNSGLTGKVAFAIALDPLTGQVYVAQYLSLHQDSATNTPNDLLSLAAGSVAVTVTLTDGDGDQVSSTADIGTHINFLDDGPTAPVVTVSAATVGVDETPAVQTTGGASDVLGSTAINFNGAATTVAGLFAGVLNKGTDPGSRSARRRRGCEDTDASGDRVINGVHAAVGGLIARRRGFVARPVLRGHWPHAQQVEALRELALQARGTEDRQDHGYRRPLLASEGERKLLLVGGNADAAMARADDLAEIDVGHGALLSEI